MLNSVRHQRRKTGCYMRASWLAGLTGAVVLLVPGIAFADWLVPVREIPDLSLNDIAVAAYDGYGPVIYYNPVAVWGVGPDLAEFVSAHEYGHIYFGHILPGSSKTQAYKREQEKQADCFAATVLAASNPAAVDAAARFFQQQGNSSNDYFHPMGFDRAAEITRCRRPIDTAVRKRIQLQSLLDAVLAETRLADLRGALIKTDEWSPTVALNDQPDACSVYRTERHDLHTIRWGYTCVWMPSAENDHEDAKATYSALSDLLVEYSQVPLTKDIQNNGKILITGKVARVDASLELEQVDQQRDGITVSFSQAERASIQIDASDLKRVVGDFVSAGPQGVTQPSPPSGFDKCELSRNRHSTEYTLECSIDNLTIEEARQLGGEVWTASTSAFDDWKRNDEKRYLRSNDGQHRMTVTVNEDGASISSVVFDLKKHVPRTPDDSQP